MTIDSINDNDGINTISNKNQIMSDINELKQASNNLNNHFTQLLTSKNEKLRKLLLNQINQIISGMIKLMENLNSYKASMNSTDQDLLDNLNENFNQYFLNIKYLTLEKSANFEYTLSILLNNLSIYPLF